MPSTSPTANPYWRCETDERAGEVDQVRRCQGCDYSLEGLPDRDGEIRCPECGQIDLPPDPSLQAARARHGAKLTVAALFSVLSGFAGLIFLSMAWDRAGHSVDVLIDFSIAVLLLYPAVAVWFAPGQRFAFSRWASACSAGVLAVWSVESMAEWETILLVPVVYNTLIAGFLIHPEVGSLWLRLRKGGAA